MFKERKCACCKKIIIRRSFVDYIYKKGDRVYCGWNCYRKDNAIIPPSSNTCVCCGEEIPEGLQVCSVCEKISKKKSGGDIYYREYN